MPKETSIQLVEAVAQSPLNPVRWLLDLKCGHEVWVTNKSRPKRKTFNCPVCRAEEKRK